MSQVISLRDFILTGRFGAVTSTCNIQQLEELFGPPEATGGQSRRYRHPTIWKYGDVQFLFLWPIKLHMIHIDTFSGLDGRPTGWDGLKIDSWHIQKGMSLKTFQSYLNDIKYELEIGAEAYDLDVVHFAAGVKVSFSHPSIDDENDGLLAISRTW